MRCTKCLNQQISGCLSADQLIKYGSTRIVFGKDITNSHHLRLLRENNPTTILVKVSHVAARLDFSQFDVTLKGFEGDPTVVFDEAKFVNLQTKTARLLKEMRVSMLKMALF